MSLDAFKNLIEWGTSAMLSLVLLQHWVGVASAPSTAKATNDGQGREGGLVIMSDEGEVKILILAGAIVMVLMAAFIVLFLAHYQQKQMKQRELLRRLDEQHQRELLEASLQSQEAERRRIAVDLHDDVGTMLSATRMSLSRANKHLGENPEAEAIMQQTRELLEETVNNVRRISQELLPSTLDQLGLVAALEEFIAKLHQTPPEGKPELLIDFHHEGLGQRLDKDIELAIYRVAQELVHNSLRHAQATRIEVLVMRQASRLLLTVSDNGVGFDLETTRQRNQSGLGLKNIESRLNIINGRVIFDVLPGKGTYVIVDVPLE
ncbi:MAG: sensor histidine kinase [Cytophagaceae bacterium]|nr:sensor histidine kinase [Cytophagaceae bacterium]